MDRIDDLLYLGNAKIANSGDELLQCGVNRVLTVDIKPVKRKRQDIHYHFVRMEDDPNWDLLSTLDECLTFIESSISEGNCILVHCFLGISRSAAVVTAYIMRRYKVDTDEALRRIRKCRPIVCPNDGFIRQLHLFHVNGCRTDSVTSAVIPFMIKSVNSSSEKSATSSANGNGNLSKPLDAVSTPSMGSHPVSVLFRCRGCRRPLFTNRALLEHTFLGSQGKSTNRNVCSLSNFVNPVEWMNQNIGIQQGKIHCPRCSARLGSFRWAGLQCGCGHWVIPGFSVQKCKVDTEPLEVHPSL
uniref:protein-tyrosine-phosphatase n=1 Tax=Trichuris muris TaxID=70415 RepID=A0A5S6QW09_TRIMR